MRKGRAFARNPLAVVTHPFYFCHLFKLITYVFQPYHQHVSRCERRISYRRLSADAGDPGSRSVRFALRAAKEGRQ